MKPIAAAVAAALIAGVTMYTVGARTASVDAFTQDPTLVQTAGSQRVLAARPVSYVTPLRTAARPVAQRRYVEPEPAVYRTAEPAQERVVTQEAKPKRSWQKTAMVIGGSAAGGAGIGAIAGGKKGAIVGAAIGGGAGSIYEAIRRH